MERLTTRFNGVAVMEWKYEEKYTTEEWIDILTNRLAAYEDIGLEPEEIKERLEAGKELFFELADLYNDLGPVDHLRELVQAEKHGCLIVHGRWIKTSSRAWEHYCSVCKGPKPYFYGYGALDSSFCPNCGAKLDLTGGHEK